MGNAVLGIDIGGTGIKIAPVDITDGKLLSEPLKIPTPKPATYSAMISLVEESIQKLNWFGTIGCGFPGVVKNGKILTAANLAPDWVNVNLSEKLSKNCANKVVVLNDADAAALAEMKFGAGKDHNHKNGGTVTLFTLGTGIGSAIFVNGKLVPNTEFGHMEMDGKDAEHWAATVIREKEGLCWEVWGARVNKFLHHIEVLFTPDLIIIGGGVSENPEKFFPYLKVKAKLVAAKMANNAGIIGAALGVEQVS